MMTKCAEKGHHYQRFDDTSLFCERCGERKVIVAEPYHWDWIYRPYIPNVPQWWQPSWPPYYIWSEDGNTTTITGTTISNGSGDES